MTGDRLGRAATLEDVFMTYTGRSLDDDVEDETTTTSDRLKGGENRCIATPRHASSFAHGARAPERDDRARRALRRAARRNRVRPSAVGRPPRSSRSVSDSPRSHLSSWLGPAKGSSQLTPTWRSSRDHRRPRAEGLVRLHRAQLLPDTPLLGLGDRLPGLFGRGRAVDLVHRRRAGQPDAAAVPDGRRDLLELPVGRVQLDRRDHRGRALGRAPSSTR